MGSFQQYYSKSVNSFCVSKSTYALGMQYLKDFGSFKSRIGEKSMYEWVTIKTSYCDWTKIILIFPVLDTMLVFKISKYAQKLSTISLDTSQTFSAASPSSKVAFIGPLRINVTGRYFNIFLYNPLSSFEIYFLNILSKPQHCHCSGITKISPYQNGKYENEHVYWILVTGRWFINIYKISHSFHLIS